MRVLPLCAAMLTLSGCSMFGKVDVETAPYTVLQAADEQNIELRHYEELILVSAPMKAEKEDGRNSAFFKLFDYISGENVNSAEIPMTAPVFMDNEQVGQFGTEIPMTAPVFMDEEAETPMMSFVLPGTFTLETAPVPKDPDVKLHALREYTAAAITFSGRLSQKNIQKHKGILENWIIDRGYKKTGDYKAAGYNAPFTLPALRRNEVLIPVEKP